MNDSLPQPNPATPKVPQKRGRKPHRDKPVLKIVLDTNQLYTGSASELLQAALRELITASKIHKDIAIEWYIPEVVRSEREYQMAEVALELLPAINRLEKLLGHNLGINPEILESRVRDAIDRQVRDLSLNILPLDQKDVDWNKVMKDALFRKPPFEKGKSEKGFRDRLIAESFLQLVACSPKTPNVCRVALVTADTLLGSCVEAQTKDLANVRIIKSLDDLRGLINTLVSTVTEEFVASLKESAGKLFFTENSKDGLYHSEKIGATISSQFQQKLVEKPANADLRENGTWYISPAAFVKKTGQRLTWRSRIQVEATAFKMEYRSVPSTPGFLLPGMSGQQLGSPYTSLYQALNPTPPLVPTGPQPPFPLSGVPASPSPFQSLISALPTEKVQVAKGFTSFHVTWTATVTSSHKLINAKVEKIEFADTVWN